MDGHPIATSPIIGGWAIATLAIVVVAAVLGAVASFRLRRAPVSLVLLVALVLRVVVVVLSFGHTPADAAIGFRLITKAAEMHHDPLTVLPRYRWNFLAFMPGVWALVDQLGFAWQYTVKIPAVAADLVSTVLVGHLVGPERRRAVQWLFATSPVAIFVTAVHGQVEPTALAFGLAAFLVARRRPFLAGLAIGLAISAKTWPAIMVPGLLTIVVWRRWWRLGAGALVAPVLFVLGQLLVFHDRLSTLVRRLVGYRSFIGTWGWTGLLRLHGSAGAGYAGPNIDRWQRIGSVVLLLAAVAVLVLLRRHGAIEITLGLILVFYCVTAGFGPQYLMWCLPFALALHGRAGEIARWLVLPFTGAFCALVYLYVLPLRRGHSAGVLALRCEVYSSLVVIAVAAIGLLSLVLQPPRTQRSAVEQPA